MPKLTDTEPEGGPNCTLGTRVKIMIPYSKKVILSGNPNKAVCAYTLFLSSLLAIPALATPKELYASGSSGNPVVVQDPAFTPPRPVQIDGAWRGQMHPGPP